MLLDWTCIFIGQCHFGLNTLITMHSEWGCKKIKISRPHALCRRVRFLHGWHIYWYLLNKIHECCCLNARVRVRRHGRVRRYRRADFQRRKISKYSEYWVKSSGIDFHIIYFSSMIQWLFLKFDYNWDFFILTEFLQIQGWFQFKDK